MRFRALSSISVTTCYAALDNATECWIYHSPALDDASAGLDLVFLVSGTTDFGWTDTLWIAGRVRGDPRRSPLSCYEVHLGSWRRGEGNRWLCYDELADRLIPYATDLGFTHVELMPAHEHPLDASAGHQPIGLFASTRRFDESFARFVDRCHAAGLGVILDWAPAYFPIDQHRPARFDVTALYEHTDPRQGFPPDWATAGFDFGQAEVVDYLIANALFWFDRYHIDGLRVGALASMLYLDYSRKAGEWLPNRCGGRENLDAIAFLRKLNEAVYARYPGALMVAEESTAWPAVTQPTYSGGLGFGFKWNIGWIHDTLDYLKHESQHRKHHHNNITFGITYAFFENFVLPLSHDELVRGKGSLLARMPGDTWQRFATLRLYYAFMWAHPGKKLLFMGQEFAQGREWDLERELEWGALDIGWHRGVQSLVRDCNREYRVRRALHERDCEADGFRWIAIDGEHSVFAWLRSGGIGAAPVAVVANFTPVPGIRYRIGLPLPGRWREIINSDSAVYGGSNVGNYGVIDAQTSAHNGYPCSAEMTLPPLGALWLVHENGV